MNQTFEIHDSPPMMNHVKVRTLFSVPLSFVFESPKAETEPSEKSLIDESHHGKVFGHDRAPRLGSYPKS